jgi:acetyl-CoA carboxylase biotin carboxylase subunit
MEMNTRIQVEHPVTEQVYGLDLLRLQIKLAAGDKLDRKQEDVVPRFHAIECRVNAEDPVKFTPSPGLITGYHQPGGYGVRVDTMAYEQYKVQPYYDSLVAKLVITGATREIALKRAMRALNEYVIEGIKTNIPFHKRVLAHPGFAAGRYDTRLVDQILNPPAPGPEAVRPPATAAR